ncbi:hypothetical protein BOTBODRAFT_340214 [Botryobasidium botryosum FD-172 SS1]|uniref:Uncharacterized protein n=1 Tax=Botryobasidium botryosum (strain FD-172 SS1) TaxID=930990 RepID=A0A067MJ67_BOTB1|nr:hypothetical protein BOTBODRAFT_340214 [Botryobasidium botryosum FD-172 SS1]
MSPASRSSSASSAPSTSSADSYDSVDDEAPTLSRAASLLHATQPTYDPSDASTSAYHATTVLASSEWPLFQDEICIPSSWPVLYHARVPESSLTLAATPAPPNTSLAHTRTMHFPSYAPSAAFVASRPRPPVASSYRPTPLVSQLSLSELIARRTVRTIQHIAHRNLTSRAGGRLRCTEDAEDSGGETLVGNSQGESSVSGTETLVDHEPEVGTARAKKDEVRYEDQGVGCNDDSGVAKKP